MEWIFSRRDGQGWKSQSQVLRPSNQPATNTPNTQVSTDRDRHWRSKEKLIILLLGYWGAFLLESIINLSVTVRKSPNLWLILWSKRFHYDNLHSQYNHNHQDVCFDVDCVLKETESLAWDDFFVSHCSVFRYFLFQPNYSAQRSEELLRECWLLTADRYKVTNYSEGSVHIYQHCLILLKVQLGFTYQIIDIKINQWS